MDMTGEERIAASRQTVWAALNDVEVLKQCIPGCESLEKQSDSEMTARVKLQVGPVSARFSGKVRLVDDGDGTILRYEARADVGGKLAQLGGRLIDATARKLAGEFFSKFGAVVGSPPASAEGNAAETEVSAGAPAKEKPGVLRRWFGKKKRDKDDGNPSM
jgi:uncharacterized protein